MKYLKKIFENEYYQQISGNDYYEEYIPFEEKYSKKLIHLGFTQSLVNLRGCSIYVNGVNAYVYQKPDEYFDVEIGMGSKRKYYRCDQFDGLLKLLKDKKII
jgi:hypothetical protein